MNKKQQEAIETIYGPEIIIACPGSGKTTTLVRRIGHMLQSGIDPNTILMMTFSTTAAKDMKKRFCDIYGATNGVTFRTIHSFCYQLLCYETGKEPEIMGERHVSVAKVQGDLSQYLERVKDIKNSYTVAKRVMDEIGLIKNNQLNPETYQSTSVKPAIFLDAFREYQRILESYGIIDFEDLMLQVLHLLKTRPEVLIKYQNWFRFIQVDEYQDTNPVQKQILYLLANIHRNICVVGDDDQSIYGFRGANPQIMLDFQKDFPDCKTVYLDTNYRSGQSIIDAADALIRKNHNRFEKKFLSARGEQGFFGNVTVSAYPSREEEIQYIARQVQKAQEAGTPYREMAVLIRNNNLANRLFSVFAKQDIPFYAKDTVRSIYDSWEFSLLSAYLRLSMGQYTETDLRMALRTPNKYLKLDQFRGCSYSIQELKNRMSYMQASWQRKNGYAAMDKMFTYFGPFKFSADSKPLDAIRAMEGLGIKNEILADAEKTNTDKEDAMMVWNALREDAAKCATLLDWNRYAMQDKQEIDRLNKSRYNQDGVFISTMHGAKGCEWSKVFVPDLNQSIIPGRNSFSHTALEEERRVLYVAMTRAKDDLELLSSGYASDFLQEMKHNLRRQNAEANKPPIGAAVRHKSLGAGVIQNYRTADADHQYIEVYIGDRTSNFPYPDAFLNGYLQLI